MTESIELPTMDELESSVDELMKGERYFDEDSKKMTDGYGNEV